MNVVLQALQFRHACKKFDPLRRISPGELEQILECGRLSPSSFGMEPWRFLVIQDPGLRERLRKPCWNQAQITDCSELIVILTKHQDVEPDSSYVQRMFARRNLPEEAEKAAFTRYRNHLKREVEPLMSHYAWCSSSVNQLQSNRLPRWNKSLVS